MKTKKCNLKLKLNKVTISNLKDKEMTAVQGGAPTGWITCGETNQCGTGTRCTQICQCTDWPCTNTCVP